jgi:SAM-dependent methyltransferase
MDPVANFKAAQRKSWATFAPFEAVTTPAAARLVSHAGIRAGQRVLDVACGTGVVAVTARILGADVTGLDLTPELLKRAKENASIAGLVGLTWLEGDAESMPFADATFDSVVSQFGHMFAPRHDVALAEMLRVLKPGGTIAFSTWPPELFTGQMFALTGKYLPPPPPGVSSPLPWGDPNHIRELFGRSTVRDVIFNADTIWFPVLSPAHHRVLNEQSAGPMIRIVEAIGNDPARLAEFRAEYDALATRYFDGNRLRQDYLMTRATKL